MLGWFKKHNRARATAVQLYGSSVAQARLETFYASWGVPDTVEGRFEIISLHLCLLAGRLQLEGEDGDNLARMVFETFVTEIDDSMREEGVADLKVPRRVRQAATGLYDRFGDYRDGLASSDSTTLEEVLRRNFAALDAEISTIAMAAYMRDSAKCLADQPAKRLLAGIVDYPPLPG